jgi:hypothetical protein
MSREAMQMALEALESDPVSHLGLVHRKMAITALRQALVNADDTSQERVDEIVKDEHEPVAWMFVNEDGECEQIEYGPVFDDPGVTPLYTAPPKKQWVGLTDEEVSEIIDREIGFNSCWGPEEAFARAIEAKLREKNQ